MILAFLSAEVDAPRYRELVRATLCGDLQLARNADLTDAAANQRRRFALGQYRGWDRNSYLFAGFPRDVRWKLVEVSIFELGEFRYAREFSWVALAGDSLWVKDGAANAATEPLDETKERILAVEGEIRRGVTFPPLVATAEGEDQAHILLEGHTRASAYVRALDPRDTREVVVGYTRSLSAWAYW